MSKLDCFEVAGVDGCRRGWCVAVTHGVDECDEPDARPCLLLKNLFVARAFAEVLAQTANCELVCVDIPVGLSDSERARACDIEARRLLRGHRASSVFPPPVRQALFASDRETASKINFEYSGRKLSCQSFNILNKIRQVDDLMTPDLQKRVREIHPEVSFWALNNRTPVEHKKIRLSGRNERMQLLSKIFPRIQEMVSRTRKRGEVAPDDIVDALAAAWTAAQTVCGRATTLPEHPARDSRGLRMEIICPIV